MRELDGSMPNSFNSHPRRVQPWELFLFFFFSFEHPSFENSTSKLNLYISV